MQFLQMIMLLVAGAIVVLLIITLLMMRPRKKFRFRRDSYVEGLKSLAEGDEKGALAHLKLAISEEPDNLDTFLKLATVLRKMGHFDKAYQIDQQLTIRPGLRKAAKKEVYWSLAQDHIGLGRNDRAISLLKELTTFDRRDTRVLETLLSLYEKQERWDEALETRRLISDLDRTRGGSGLAVYYAWVGGRLLQKGDRRGESVLKQALKVDDECVPALLGLGDALYKNGQVEQAIRSWRRVVDEVPEFAWLAFQRLEKAYFEQGRFGEVERIYDNVLQKEPKNVRALGALARIYEKKGDIDGALDAFSRILDVEPTSASATVGLMRLHVQAGELEKAEEHAKNLSNWSFPGREEYACSKCGYGSQEYLWRCPRCRQWKTFK